MYCITFQRAVKSKAKGKFYLSERLQIKSSHGVVMRLLVCVILGSDICKYNLFQTDRSLFFQTVCDKCVNFSFLTGK